MNELIFTQLIPYFITFFAKSSKYSMVVANFHRNYELRLLYYYWNYVFRYIRESRTTILQDVQSRFSVQLAFAKFLSKIKGKF